MKRTTSLTGIRRYIQTNKPNSSDSIPHTYKKMSHANTQTHAHTNESAHIMRERERGGERNRCRETEFVNNDMKNKYTNK